MVGNGTLAVIYPMPGNNATLRINFTDLRKWNFVRSLFGTPVMDKVGMKATKLIYLSNNQLVTNTKELNTKILYKFCKFIYNLTSTKFL